MPNLILISCAPLAGTAVVVLPAVLVELVPADAPVLLVVSPTAALLIPFRVVGVEIVETAKVDIDGFVLVVVASGVVLTTTGSEVEPARGVVEVVVL
jgi:hypothetical protein